VLPPPLIAWVPVPQVAVTVVALAEWETTVTVPVPAGPVAPVLGHCRAGDLSTPWLARHQRDPSGNGPGNRWVATVNRSGSTRVKIYEAGQPLTKWCAGDYGGAVRVYHFTGVVFPERAPLTFLFGEEVELHHAASGWKGNVRVSVIASQISVIARSEADLDIYTLKNLLQETCRGLVDGIGYVAGRGYEVELTAATDVDGGHVVFGIGVPVLEEAQSERPVSPERVLELTLAYPWLRRALGELRRAIREPGDTGFHCYRAVESVRQHFRVSGDTGASASWERMREALNLSEGWIMQLKMFADAQRHGESPYASDLERAADMTRAWRVVDRFVVLLAEGLERLEDNRFPTME
jgi:hypothetical protein